MTIIDLPFTIASQPIYSWAFETKVTGAVDGRTIEMAARDFRAKGAGRRVWILDAGDTTAMSGDVLGEVTQQLASLRAVGLERVGLILPLLARPFVGMINAAPIVIVPFGSRDEAIRWVMRGCR